MFDRDLFYELCGKYNVELSEYVEEPMIKDGNGVHAITGEDISRVFTPCQTYFGYSDNKIDANIKTKAFYFREDFAIAC